MLQGGGKMVIAANNLKTGPGHFGRYIEEEGVEKMSFHYESDFRQGGRSVLAIRPLLWKNDWPVAGDEFHAGNYGKEGLEIAKKEVPDLVICDVMMPVINMPDI